MDVLVLLEGPVNYGRDLQTEIKTFYASLLQTGRRISPAAVAAS
jgi:hypothetical protein